MDNTLKDFMENDKEKTEQEQFNGYGLTESDIKVLKANVLSEDVPVPALINLVLREKAGNVIKEENKEDLLLREYINESGNVTEKGKEYINSDEVKEKLSKLLDG